MVVWIEKTQDVKSLFMNINELNKYHKNPRKITSKQHDFLEQTMQEFGDLSGVVFNKTTGEVVGGNQRTSIFKKYADKVKIEKTEQPKDAQGTIAIGYIDFNGSKFSYREVEWDTEKEARANIIANKAGGFWDNDVLANEFDEDLLLSAGFEDFELGIFDAKDIDLSERAEDKNPLQSDLDTYLDGSIKQIVLYFQKSEYDEIIDRLEAIQLESGLTSFTDVFKLMLETYENTKSN